MCGRKPWRKWGPAPWRGPLWALAAPFLEVTWPPGSAAEASPAGSAVCAEPAEGSWVCGLEQVSPPPPDSCAVRTGPSLQGSWRRVSQNCRGPRSTQFGAAASQGGRPHAHSPQGPRPPAQHQAQGKPAVTVPLALPRGPGCRAACPVAPAAAHTHCSPVLPLPPRQWAGLLPACWASGATPSPGSQHPGPAQQSSVGCGSWMPGLEVCPLHSPGLLSG